MRGQPDRDVRVVRHHQDGVAGVVQFAENLDNDVSLASSRLPVARRQNDLR